MTSLHTTTDESDESRERQLPNEQVNILLIELNFIQCTSAVMPPLIASCGTSGASVVP